MTKKKQEATQEPVSKQYNLKKIELAMLGNINSRHNAEMLDFLSFVSMERIGLEVTPNTQFKVDEGGVLTVTEMPQPPEQPKEDPKEEVSVA